MTIREICFCPSVLSFIPASEMRFPVLYFHLIHLVHFLFSILIPVLFQFILLLSPLFLGLRQ